MHPPPRNLVAILFQCFRSDQGDSVLRRMALPLLILLSSSAMGADPLIVTMELSNYNGFEVSCFGEKDGWVNLAVTGGATPYSYKWSNGSVQQDVSNLSAGYYKVDVIDHDGQIATAEVTLDQPLAMKLDVDVYEYTNGYNISCYECSNGNASVAVLGGAPPFSITWSDGPTGTERYNLAAKDYKIAVADANGCAGTSTTIYLRGPARSDWSMSGNSGTTPGVHYIGTSDAKDLVFKSHGMESLRLKSDGSIQFPQMSNLGGGLLGIDASGILQQVHDNFLTGLPGPYWSTGGNWLNGTNQWLGTSDAHELVIKTNSAERMRITPDGLIGIGTSAPTTAFEIHRESGPSELLVTSSGLNAATAWVKNEFGTALGMSVDLSGAHIIESYGANPTMTFRSGKVGIGTTNMVSNDYKLFVTGGILTEKIQINGVTNWPDYVLVPNYELRTPTEVAAFIKQYGHLPDVPSALEMSEQGMNLAATNILLMKKVEELTLYIIELEARMTKLETK